MPPVRRAVTLAAGIGSRVVPAREAAASDAPADVARRARYERPRQFLLLAFLFLLFSAIYEFTRYLVGTESLDLPLANARDIIAIERKLGLFFEPELQRAVTGNAIANQLSIWIYTYEHLIGSIIFCAAAWLWLPRRFPFIWRWFWIAHAVAILGFWLYPLAPPRLVPELGLIDPTAAELAAAPGAGAFAHIRNEFAAMPSLHVGYTLFYALVLWWVLPRTWWRWLAWLWPITLLFVVMATANHYWLDGLGGAIAVGVSLAVTLVVYRDLPRPWSPDPAPEPRAAASG
jgi:hypothetical protein